MEHDEILYGGLIARSPSTVEEEATQTSKGRKMRKRKSVNEDEEAPTGKRGRPRVDVKDQNAVERRRTQIRLAQRAYRERKESTINSLEKRVDQLKAVTNEMNREFLDYSDRVLAAGIVERNSALEDELRSTTQRFLQLARSIDSGPSSDEDEPTPSSDPRGSTSRDPLQTVMPRTALHEEVFTIPSTSALLADPMSFGGYEILFDEQQPYQSVELVENSDYMMYQFSNPPPPPPNYEGSNNQQRNNPWGNTDYEQFNLSVPQTTMNTPQTSATLSRALAPITNPPTVRVFTPISNSLSTRPQSPTSNPLPSPTLSPTLPLPYTYSFQETTFARRLTRSGLEDLYCLMVSPTRNPALLDAKLRFAYCHFSLPVLTARTRALLQRSREEPLEYFDLPLLHLGGAGLHYPRDPKDEISEGWAWAPKMLGRSQYGAADLITPEEYAKMVKVEGVWFDSNDVEWYLRGKGVELDGTSVGADVDLDVTLPALEMDSGSRRSSAAAEAEAEAESLFPHSSTVFEGLATPEVVSPGEGSGAHDGASGDEGTKRWEERMVELKRAVWEGAKNGEGELPLFGYAARSRVVTINVDRLLESLNSRGMCIGRCPGYRKEDVDLALMEALYEAQAMR